MRLMMLGAALLFTATGSVHSQDSFTRPPIIDVHLHADAVGEQPSPDAAEILKAVFPGERLTSVPAAQSTDELVGGTLAALERHNIVKAVIFGDRTADYRKAFSDRFLLGITGPLEAVRGAVESGGYHAIAEFAPQYGGKPPNHPDLEEYYALAEEMDVPVGLHIGLGPPGAAYSGAPRYRMLHSNPLLLEEVLVRHPKLRLYVMHAGWPMLDEMVGLLYAHPQVYADVGIISWGLPEAEFYSYLRRLVDAGFARRIMFGTDQMQWPSAIDLAIGRVESAPFLSEERHHVPERDAASSGWRSPSADEPPNEKIG